jgi:hypothetical protein
MPSFTIGNCSVCFGPQIFKQKYVKDIMFSSFLEKLGHCYITVNWGHNTVHQNKDFYVPATKWLGHIVLPMSAIPK